MTFEEAVKKAPAPVSGAYKPGKRALGGYSGKILSRRGSFTGSIDLDTALKRHPHGQGNPWDYGLGYELAAKERAIWLEVHPASDGEVGVMVKKLEWLRAWLKDHGKDLRALTGSGIADTYFWAATNGVAITPNSPQARKLASSGMSMPRNAITLP